ncbi:galactose-binding domain-like protein, partial [Armillaria nabsnona]
VSFSVSNATGRVSSTLDKSTGKANLIDGSPETCWTSQQGLPQFVQLAFPAMTSPVTLSITFQGGFVGTECRLQVPDEAGKWTTAQTVYPEDVNRAQEFELDPAKFHEISALKIVMVASSDFFGRITIYNIELR